MRASLTYIAGRYRPQPVLPASGLPPLQRELHGGFPASYRVSVNITVAYGSSIHDVKFLPAAGDILANPTVLESTSRPIAPFDGGDDMTAADQPSTSLATRGGGHWKHIESKKGSDHE